MSSIGPQLPPHLQKRKRTPEDDADSPPAKVSRQTSNDDEIPLDDDSSDDSYGPSAAAPRGPSTGPSIGPSLPPTTTRPVAKPSIGPTLPPAPTNDDEIALDSDSDSNDIGPAAPVAKANIGPSLPPPSPPKPKRVIGPAPPPAPLSERPTTGPDSDSGSDSEDDWGPALPSATTSSSRNVGPSLPPSSTTSVSESTAPKRDSWMIAPPTDSSYRASDPTKLKARKFTAGPRANTEAGGGGVSSIWTETPEQKLQRLTNAVLGREDPSAAESSPSSSASADPYNTKRKVDEERIKAFTEQTRGRSLVEEHQALKATGKGKASSGRSAPSSGGHSYGQPEGQGGQQEEGDDDPSARPFDREKDMAIGGRLSGVKKREIMKSAANFGGRFQKGNYL